MSHYKNHMFICTNKKDPGKQCCGNHAANEMVAYAKQRAHELGLNKEKQFRISSSGCMGQCANGPVLVVYPAGAWYTYKNKQDIDDILMAVANEQTRQETS